mgnify:CR=1 FL=1
MRVIVVEDNVLFCNYICNFLQKADLDTVRTYRLAQAKKFIGTSVREDDIVLADLRLPDGESTTLLQWMRENGYMHPFIMMTNYEEIHSAVHTMKLGAEDYILKPLVETRLLPVIKKIRTVNEAFTFTQPEVIPQFFMDINFEKCLLFRPKRRFVPNAVSTLYHWFIS